MRKILKGHMVVTNFHTIHHHINMKTSFPSVQKYHSTSFKKLPTIKEINLLATDWSEFTLNNG
jgi:hypothetical protein